jgi:hypothetical protein
MMSCYPKFGVEYRVQATICTPISTLAEETGDYGELLETVPGMGYSLHSKKPISGFFIWRFNRFFSGYIRDIDSSIVYDSNVG